jgi:hypothetical protein
MVTVQLWLARTGATCMFSGDGVVKMYYFAIDFEAEMPYPLAPPQGWEAQDRSLKTSSKQSAVSIQPLAKLVRLRLFWIVRLPAAPLAHDDGWMRGDLWAARHIETTTLCRLGIGIGFGPPLGHPRATQGPPKRHASVSQALIPRTSFVYNKS